MVVGSCCRGFDDNTTGERCSKLLLCACLSVLSLPYHDCELTAIPSTAAITEICWQIGINFLFDLSDSQVQTAKLTTPHALSPVIADAIGAHELTRTTNIDTEIQWQQI